jgi:hypothetical protein
MLLFIIGGLFIGIAIVGSGRLPLWSGWLYAVTTIGFALGLFFPPIVMNVMSGLLFIATVSVAWTVSREAVR